MSRQNQRFRAIKDDTCNPTLFKIIQSQTFINDETLLSHVDEFINNHPSNNINSDININNNNNNNSSNSTPAASYTGINPTVLSQLNRLQRNLRGLPPLFEDDSATTSTAVVNNNINNNKSLNTKIIFD